MIYSVDLTKIQLWQHTNRRIPIPTARRKGNGLCVCLRAPNILLATEISTVTHPPTSKVSDGVLYKYKKKATQHSGIHFFPEPQTSYQELIWAYNTLDTFTSLQWKQIIFDRKAGKLLHTLFLKKMQEDNILFPWTS